MLSQDFDLLPGVVLVVSASKNRETIVDVNKAALLMFGCKDLEQLNDFSGGDYKNLILEDNLYRTLIAENTFGNDDQHFRGLL